MDFLRNASQRAKEFMAMAELKSIFEVNDRVLIMDGDLTGCMGVVREVGAGGLLAVKPDQSDQHPAIVIQDSAVQLREFRHSRA
jgi:hypothetical protein